MKIKAIQRLNTVEYIFHKTLLNLFPDLLIRPMIKYIGSSYPKNNITGVEIGVHFGDNAKNILRVLDINKLYLIDPFIIYNDSTTNIPFEDQEKNFLITKNKLEKYKDKIVFLRETSENAVDKVPDNLDFVYIDGNHSYEFVKKDINLYYIKLKSGGVLGGHDFSGDCIGVVRAVSEFVKKNNLKLFTEKNQGCDWWVIKK